MLADQLFAVFVGASSKKHRGPSHYVENAPGATPDSGGLSSLDHLSSGSTGGVSARSSSMNGTIHVHEAVNWHQRS